MRNVQMFYGYTSRSEEAAVYRNGTNTHTATLNLLVDSQRSDGEEEKWHLVVLTLTEHHKAKLYPALLILTKMWVPGQRFGEIRIKNRIKLKVASQQQRDKKQLVRSGKKSILLLDCTCRHVGSASQGTLWALRWMVRVDTNWCIMDRHSVEWSGGRVVIDERHID